MLDFITRRRLIVGFTAIAFVTISIVLFRHLRSETLQSYAPSVHASNASTIDNQAAYPCYLSESVDVTAACHKCKAFERRSHAMGCSPTGYRELVSCPKVNKEVYRSCPVPIRVQKEHFWYFEGVILVISLLAILSVYSRQRTMDKQMVEKIKRQIEISGE